MPQNSPFVYSDTNKRYHTYDYYLRRRYGSKCARIPIDAGFSCPNREGGMSGCIYCSARGSGDFCAKGTANGTADGILSPAAQFAHEYDRLSAKWAGRLPAIPYFQAFSGTYAPTADLRALYDAALSYTDRDGRPVDIPAISIATRPDCLSRETVAYLAELNTHADVTVELGLQSSHDATLRRIRRGHDYDTFLRGFETLRRAGIAVCVHIINGLPTEDADVESREQMLQTAARLGALRPDFVKIHMLHVLRNTPLADEYERGHAALLSLQDYVSTVCDQLGLLPPETVICRLTGDGPAEDVIAPLWTKNKRAVLAAIDRTLAGQNRCQGDRFTGGDLPS